MLIEIEGKEGGDMDSSDVERFPSGDEEEEDVSDDPVNEKEDDDDEDEDEDERERGHTIPASSRASTPPIPTPRQTPRPKPTPNPKPTSTKTPRKSGKKNSTLQPTTPTPTPSRPSSTRSTRNPQPLYQLSSHPLDNHPDAQDEEAPLGQRSRRESTTDTSDDGADRTDYLQSRTNSGRGVKRKKSRMRRTGDEQEGDTFKGGLEVQVEHEVDGLQGEAERRDDEDGKSDYSDLSIG
jgi:hypothetical protein